MAFYANILQFEKATVTSSQSIATIQNFFGVIQTNPERDEHNTSYPKTLNNNTNHGLKEWQCNGIQGQKTNVERPQNFVKYEIQNRFWLWMFNFGSFLGDDAFYHIFVPFWIFNINPVIIRKLLLLWAIAMYVGQSSKEIFKCPRPQSPPVVPLEPRYFKEYGMPSTHAMVGTLFPFGILFLTMKKVEYSIPIGIFVASTWTLLVCFSRLYKGMHYVLDVVVGVFLTFVLLAMLFPLLDTMDEFLIKDSQAPLLLVGVTTFLSLTYPSQRGWSSTREDTIVILTVTGGIYTSLWLSNHFNWFPERYNDDLPDTITWPSLVQVGAMFCREAIGVAVSLVTHVIVKPIMLEILSFIYSIEINSETKKWLSVEFPYKFVTYTIVSMTFMLVSPMLFSMVGL